MDKNNNNAIGFIYFLFSSAALEQVKAFFVLFSPRLLYRIIYSNVNLPQAFGKFDKSDSKFIRRV